MAIASKNTKAYVIRIRNMDCLLFYNSKVLRKKSEIKKGCDIHPLQQSFEKD